MVMFSEREGREEEENESESNFYGISSLPVLCAALLLQLAKAGNCSVIPTSLSAVSALL